MSNSDFDIPAKSVRQPKAAAQPSAQVEEVQKVEAEKKPAEKPKYDKTELLAIFDEIIFTGEYVEEVMIRGRMPVKFATRTAAQVDEVQADLDKGGYTLISSVEQRRTFLNLVQALASFNGTDLSKMPKQDRYAYVSKLAGPVIGILLEALNEFDAKVAAACREEANF